MKTTKKTRKLSKAFRQTPKSVKVYGLFPNDLLNKKELDFRHIEILNAHLEHAAKFRSKDRQDTTYHNDLSKNLKEIFGNDYRRYYRDLESWGCIRINNRYLSSETAKKTAKKAFAKSSAVRGDVLNQELIEIEYYVPESFAKNAQKKNVFDKGEYKTIYHQRIYEIHSKLEWVGPVPRTVEGRRFYKLIMNNIVNGKKQTNERFGSILLQMPTKYRKNVRLNGERIANVDIKNAVQSILQIVLENSPEELEQWKRLCNQGKSFHENVRKIFKIDGRKSKQWIKDRIMHALGSKPIETDSKANIIANNIKEFFEDNFPTIMEWKSKLERDGKTVAGTTQRYEARMMEKFIMENLDLEMIPACDGVFCATSKASEIQNRLEKYLLDTFKIETGCSITNYDDSERDKKKEIDRIIRDRIEYFGCDPFARL